MFFAFLVLITALAISATAAYYSIVGLMAIFSGATLSVAVMGSVLEVGKLVTASWLYQYWKQVPFLLKTYLTIAVFVLMLITSMGIFGYLSKAYLEQSAMSEEQIAQIQVYTEKLERSEIKIRRWNEEIGRLNRGEDFRVDKLIEKEQAQLEVIYGRMGEEKKQFQTIADEQIQVQNNKIKESADRTKSDIELLLKREKSDQREKDIDKVRKRDRGTAWVARRDIGVINEQLRKDLEKIDKQYESQIAEINERIAELRNQAKSKTVDIDSKIDEFETLIESEQVKADLARTEKLKYESKYRQLEVEVGPVKYIADMLYGDSAETMLDSAVRGVIITLIFVFDPLAVLLVIAGNMTFAWHGVSRRRKISEPEPEPEPEIKKEPEPEIKKEPEVPPTLNEEMAKVESEIEQARKQNDDKLIVDKENIDSMPEETSETLTVQKENAARWNNSTEKEQWEANVLNKLDGEKRSWILNNWAKNGFKNPKAYLSFLNKFGH